MRFIYAIAPNRETVNRFVNKHKLDPRLVLFANSTHSVEGCKRGGRYTSLGPMNNRESEMDVISMLKIREYSCLSPEDAIDYLHESEVSHG